MKLKRLAAPSAIVLLVVGAAIIGTGLTLAAGATNDEQQTCGAAPGEEVTIATAKLIIEYNSTDDDIGVHGAFDDHGWHSQPDGRMGGCDRNRGRPSGDHHRI